MRVEVIAEWDTNTDIHVEIGIEVASGELVARFWSTDGGLRGVYELVCS